MKKANNTKDLEEYLEAHASDLIDLPEEAEELVKHAKEDEKARKARAATLQKLRRDKLKLSQSQLAKAVGANVRTLQSWETGRQDYPKSVEILMNLMKQIPDVRKALLPPTPAKSKQKGEIGKRKLRIKLKQRGAIRATKKSAA